jgi:formate hydrogenlyase subunit 4
MRDTVILCSEFIQMFLVLLVAPGIAGITRRVKARFMRRQAPPSFSHTQ